MTLAYAAKLGLTTQKTSVRTQKIDGLALETYDIISARFLLQNSLEKIRFFKENFLLANTSMKIVLEISFVSLSNTNIEFAELEKLTWRTYTIAEALSTTSQVKLIDKREFAKAALNEYFETFVVHIAILKVPTAMLIHLLRTSQVQGLNEPTLATL